MKSIRFLDVSRIPPVLKDTVAIERVLQLREILDRIDLPPLADVPDQQAMTHVSPSDGGYRIRRSTLSE